ncbi:MAG TPA: hypothetical protein VMD98_12820 [Bryocella sp.]|nr:hypothetical protein [Bryocella sp.]
MLDAWIVPEKTVITAKGDSQALDISPTVNRVFLLTLSIASIAEQESIEVAVFTSPDGTSWESKPAASLSQKFYVGEYPLLVDLIAKPEAKFVRAHWEISRWGRGATTPQFEIGLRVREVPQEALREAQAEAQARR